MIKYLLVALLISSCGIPPVSKLISALGIKCKAEITIPDGRVGERVEVDVRIFDCLEVE